MQPMQTVSVHDLASAHATGAHLVDVREPDEFASGHVPGARLVPLAQVPAALDSLPRDEPVYLICHSGGRSAQAGHYLAQQGLDARNVDGGTSGWIAAGYPVER